MPKKVKQADQRADTRGGQWAGLPHVVLDSDAYLDLTLFARAVLTEIVRKFNGYNNGTIGVGYDYLMQRLSNTNKRKIRQAFVDLMNHGFISTEVEADWKGRRTREYRLTFANTTPGGRHKPATNDYKDWVKPKQKAGITSSPLQTDNGDDVSPLTKNIGDASSPGKFQKLRNTVKNSASGKAKNGDASSPHIYTIPPDQKTRKRTNIQSKPPRVSEINCASDFDSIVRTQIGNGWLALATPAKIKLAHLHRISECEIESYIRGDQQFSAAKLMAIRSDLLPGS